MHDFTGKNGTQFFFNGDFSGNIKIMVDSEALIDDAFKDKTLVKVNFSDILELVAEYVKSEKIEKLEEAEAKEILLGMV